METDPTRTPFDIRVHGFVSPDRIPELFKVSGSLAEALGDLSLEQTVEVRLNAPGTSAVNVETSARTPLDILSSVVIKRYMDGEELEASLHQLGTTLRARRKEIKRSLRFVASSAGITAAYLGIIEAAENPKTHKASRPSIDKLQNLAEVLELDVNEILAMAGYEIVMAEEATTLETGDS